MEFPPGVLNSIAKGLSGKAEALLPFGLAVVGLGAVWAGVNPWLAFGFVGIMYVLYILRSEKNDKHEEKMARFALEKTDRENVARLAQAKQRLLSKKPK